MVLVYVLLTAFAYRGLLGGTEQAELTRQLEEWFFIPTETLGPLVVGMSLWLLYRRLGRLR